MDKYIYGGDTETLRGKPLSMQFYSEDTSCDEIHFVNEDTAAKTFLAWVAKRKRNVQHVVYVHNLGFDLPEFFWGHHAKLISGSGEFQFKIGKWNIQGVYGAPTFCRITNGHDVSVMLVDSMSWFRGSLAKAADMFCPDLPKLKRPDGLGEKKFTKKDTGFCAYAMRDAVIDYHIGKSIEAMHQKYDLMQCVSVADMAARVFRHKYLHYTIPQPGRDIIEASLLSYHGGKNNVSCDPGWYSGITSIDISSAYPHAMSEMPAFSNEKLYKRFKGKRVNSVPDYGVYKLTGTLAKCAWPVVFSHGFKALSGNCDGVWVQGFEVNEALRSGELNLSKIDGFYYDAERDHQASALRNFVAEFYALKDAETDPVLRYMYKLILNSISGKFIQTRKRGSCAFTDIDANATVTASELVAGGMFHPFIASAITAHTRARIHRLEHKYAAIHTATDGIFTQKTVSVTTKRSAGDLQPYSRGGLGALTVEAKDATLLLVRNKCYVLYLDAAGKKTNPSLVFKGKHISKAALHGFQGSVTELEKMIATGRRTYTVNRPNRLKESLKRGLTPNDFVERKFVLKVGKLPVS
jgi:DNA polymerase type B, organellar and viral.